MLSVCTGLQIYMICLITVLLESMPAITLLFCVWCILKSKLKCVKFISAGNILNELL